MSTLGSQDIGRLSLHIPPAGSWWADVTLAAAPLPAPGSRLTLTVGDLTLLGTVKRAATEDAPNGTGSLPRVIMQGGLGWEALLPRGGAYMAPGGVRLLTVLQDLAGLAGEPYVAPGDVLLPDNYRWPTSTATEPVRCRSVLASFVRRGALTTWRMDPATGLTRFDAWPSAGAADSKGRVTKRDGDRGIRFVGLDTSVAAFLPGATLEGATIARVKVYETAGALTCEAWES